MKFFKMSMPLAICLALLGCSDSDSINQVKDGFFSDYSSSISIGQALSNSYLCKDKKQSWKELEGPKGEQVIEFTCKDPNFIKPNLTEIIFASIATGASSDMPHYDEYIKNPILVLYSEAKKSKKDDNFTKAIKKIDPNSMTLHVQFDVAKDGSDSFSLRGMWVSYKGSDRNYTVDVESPYDLLDVIYNDKYCAPLIIQLIKEIKNSKE